MKKILFSVSVFLLSTMAIAQDDKDKVVSDVVVNKDQNNKKGPRYKNEYNPAKVENPGELSASRPFEKPSPEFKNKRNYSVPVVGDVKVVTSTLKGPEYKNKRF